MTDFVSHRAQSTFWLIAASMLAISFHILATININGVNLRVGSSDFLLPVLFAMMVWAWVRNSGAKFESRLPHLWAWLSAMMYCLTLLRTDRGKQADPLATGSFGLVLCFSVPPLELKSCTSDISGFCWGLPSFCHPCPIKVAPAAVWALSGLSNPAPCRRSVRRDSRRKLSLVPGFTSAAVPPTNLH